MSGRPFYETANQRDRALAAAQLFTDQFFLPSSVYNPCPLDTVDYELQATPSAYPVDYALVRRSDCRVEALLEVKCRSYKSSEHAHYMLSLQKLDRLCNLSRLVRTFLLVDYVDAQWVWQCHPTVALDLYMTGRSDRGDSADQEPCAYIPKSWGQTFSKLVPAVAG